MSEYDNVRCGRLVLKGKVKKSKKHKHKSKGERSNKKNYVDDDAFKHGGWWKVSNISEITGPIAIQTDEGSYIKSLDNGLLALGAPHNGEGPDTEEVLVAFRINEDKVAFKSGYGKYLKAESNGIVTARSDAVGTMEQWTPIFKEGKIALLSENGYYMSINSKDDACVTLQKDGGQAEPDTIIIRSCAARQTDVQDEKSIEEKLDLSQMEVNFVKKFQKTQNKKIVLNKADTSELEKAKAEGNLHEMFLDRRSKLRADRYCK